MDPAQTVDACLCFGAGVAVAMGCSLTASSESLGPVFCVTGDSDFLHSGQACLEEAIQRRSRFVTVVLDNGGARSTGGQSLPGTIRVPSGMPVRTVRHEGLSAESYRLALAQLAEHAGPSLLHVKC
jgi:TPP-dependent indolepyruvate ferredoxin oxidoreductase alpha subunit